jgi:DNA-binding transcriptional LysR family regulator
MDARAPNSEQILVFLAVVDQGSFSAAARHLQRAQSAVTYAIQQLESDLGVALFDRSGRRPLLTPAGNALVGNARRVARELSSIQCRARGLNQGLEAELTLVVDSIFPMSNLLDIVRAFAEKFPTVPARVLVESLGGPAEKILDRTCMVGIVGPIVTGISKLSYFPIGAIERIPVASPTHPLAKLAGEILSDVLADHVQIVMSDRSALTHGLDFGVLSSMPLRVSDLGAKHQMILAGLGWGSLPRHIVEADLRENRLVRLHPMGSGNSQWLTDVPVYAAHHAEVALGPAASWMFAWMKTAMASKSTENERPRLMNRRKARG